VEYLLRKGAVMYSWRHNELLEQSDQCLVQTAKFLTRLALRRQQTRKTVERARHVIRGSIGLLRDLADLRGNVEEKFGAPAHHYSGGLSDIPTSVGQ